MNSLKRLSIVACFLVLYTQSTAAADCDFGFWYANTGPVDTSGAFEVRIACLEPGGCASLIYAPSSCDGCFDPSCSPTAKVQINSMTFGEVRSLSRTAGFGETPIGDTVCSTDQVSVVSAGSSNPTEFYEWSPASLSGTKFVYGTSRATPTKCAVYAFHAGANVVLKDGIGNEASVTVAPFGRFTSPSFLTGTNDIVSVVSNNQVVVSCWFTFGIAADPRDFVNLVPVGTDPVFGFDSRSTIGMMVNCDALTSDLGGASPSCVSSDGSAPAIANVNSNTVFSVTDTGSVYSGPGIKCSPAGASCIAMFTSNDQTNGNGEEATIAVPASRFASTFVLASTSEELAFVSDTAATCTVDDAGIVTNVVLGGSGQVRKQLASGSFDSGTTISCTAPVALVAQFGVKEYNMHGLEDLALWAGLDAVPTCSPTSSPTQNPTREPTREPTSLSPSASPTLVPTSNPSLAPTSSPSQQPTTGLPSVSPTSLPTQSPNTIPTVTPTREPTIGPSVSPSHQPTIAPIDSGGSVKNGGGVLNLSTETIAIIGVASGAVLLCAATTFVVRRRDRNAKAKQRKKDIHKKRYKNGIIQPRERTGSTASQSTVGSRRSAVSVPFVPTPLNPRNSMHEQARPSMDFLQDDDEDIEVNLDNFQAFQDGEFSDEEFSPMV